MRVMTQFEKWLDEVNKIRKEYWDKNFTYKPYEPLTYTKGRNYVKIMDSTSVWGFVAMKDNPKKGEIVGDLLKAASYNTPARRSRGNIFNGTDQWKYYGPKYLK
jgi:hypothetical protein